MFSISFSFWASFEAIRKNDNQNIRTIRCSKKYALINFFYWIYLSHISFHTQNQYLRLPAIIYVKWIRRSYMYRFITFLVRNIYFDYIWIVKFQFQCIAYLLYLNKINLIVSIYKEAYLLISNVCSLILFCCDKWIF